MVGIIRALYLGIRKGNYFLLRSQKILNRRIRLNRHADCHTLEENAGNFRLLLGKNCLQLHHRSHIDNITQRQITFCHSLGNTAALHFLIKLRNHHFEHLLLADSHREIIGCRVDKALCLKQHIAVICLHVGIGRIILRRCHKLVSTAKSFGLQLLRSFRHAVAFRYGKAHLFDASLNHNINNLLVAHAAVNLIGTCLQLGSQSLPARLHFKGSGIFYQLLFMQQLGDIRRSHAILDNNQARALYGKVLIVALSVKINCKCYHAGNQQHRQSTCRSLHRIVAHQRFKLFYIHQKTSSHRIKIPDRSPVKLLTVNYSSSSNISSYLAATASYSSSVGAV